MFALKDKNETIRRVMKYLVEAIIVFVVSYSILYEIEAGRLKISFTIALVASSVFAIIDLYMPSVNFPEMKKV